MNRIFKIDAKRFGLILALSMMASANAWSQTASTAPAKQTDPANQTSGSTDQAKEKGSDPSQQTPEKQTDAADQTSGSTDQTKKKSSDPSQQTAAKKVKRGQLVIAPIPITSPAVGSGLVLAAGYVFKLNPEDKVSSPSVVGLVGAFTSSGSRGGGIGGRLYFAENKYQTTFALAKGRVNFDFFGIGRIPGRDPISVPLKMGGTVFYGEFLRNVGHNIFVGPRYQRRNLYVRLDGIQTPGGFEIPPVDLHSISSALGFHVQRDKRDSTFYPTKGSLLDVNGDFFLKGLGSRRQYQFYKVSYNGYHQLAPKQILAYRGMVCSANQSVPFYDLCFYGANNDLRGYTSGEFQNRRLFATQAEYRRELKGRLGVVAFGGIGGVARRWNAFRTDELMPAAGAGLRFKVEKENHINYRIDFAVGREGHTLTIGIGEAF